MPLFVSIARHESLWIKATGSISPWRQNDRGYGFYGDGGIPYPGDRGLQIGLNIRVRPKNKSPQFLTFPENLEINGDLVLDPVEGLGLYAVKNGKAGVLIVVGGLSDQLEQEKAIYFEPVVLIRGTEHVRIQMNVSVRILPSPPRQIGDIPEWDTQFFQGGLPSLGKKRP